MDIMSRRTAQEKEHGTQEMLGILKEQKDMLRHLVDLQKKQFEARLPLQPMQNGIPTSPCSPSETFQ